MNRLLVALSASVAVLALAPAANATILLPSQGGVAFSPIDASTRGTLLASIETLETDPNPAIASYTAFFRSAVYRNTMDTLDFYFQVAVNSIDLGDEIFNLTASSFAGYQVDALVDRTDFDGAGIFTAVSNPNLDLNEPAGSTTTTSRSGGLGSVVRADFGQNGLEAAGQTSATYIFRTNATDFNFGGSFTTQDGSVASRANYQPIGAPVPEPATWAMMLIGFGMIGFGLRRREKVTTRVRYSMA